MHSSTPVSFTKENSLGKEIKDASLPNMRATGASRQGNITEHKLVSLSMVTVSFFPTDFRDLK